MNTMKAAVNSKDCWGCGYCAATCPAVFKISDKDGKAHVHALPTADNAQLAKDISEACPARVIEVWED